MYLDFSVERAPQVAGSFYPDNPRLLREEVTRLIQLADLSLRGEVIGLLAPHAGYVYSGSVAGSAYSTVEGECYDTVILVSPSHREAFNFASILANGCYKTPLGPLNVDESMASRIAEFDNGSRLSEHGHHNNGMMGEHSLEVQLPFLQIALDDAFKIVPIVMGAQHAAAANSLAQAIARAVRSSGKRVLLVASSDLSHFHTDEEARRLDTQIWKSVSTYDTDSIWVEIESGRGEACGVGPIVTVMVAARELGADQAIPLDYGTSGDVPLGRRDSVVGYLSAAFIRREGE